MKNSDRSNSTSTSLLVRLKGGDSNAWERLVSLYSRLVFSWCRRAGFQDADCADITQEVFKSVASNIDSFERRETGSFRKWLFTITRSKCADFLRNRGEAESGAGGTDALKRLAEVADSEANELVETGSAESPYAQVLKIAQAYFEDQTWQAFWRVTIQQEKTSDVAASLGITVNAVRKAKSRVLSRLREEFGDLLESQ